MKEQSRDTEEEEERVPGRVGNAGMPTCLLPRSGAGSPWLSCAVSPHPPPPTPGLEGSMSLAQFLSCIQ